MKKDKCSPYHLYLPMFFWMIAVWIQDWSVWTRDWIKASWWRALLECGLVLFSPKTPVKTVVWPTTFPWGPHLFSVVHGLLEGLPTSQHLISHTSTSYICVRHTLILSLSLSLSLALFKGLGAITKPILTGRKYIFKIHPKLRLSRIVYSSCGSSEGSSPSCSAATGEHLEKFPDFIFAVLAIIIVFNELK